ncbi:MlaD family protein [Nocardia higoensis]|uniref:MlaD family protein n=1 Tax=Nocardia higoensis TaxID=228599 RepID=UPI001FE1C4F2|nr:MlaD family protein [Nocardia higoensis]
MKSALWQAKSLLQPRKSTPRPTRSPLCPMGWPLGSVKSPSSTRPRGSVTSVGTGLRVLALALTVALGSIGCSFQPTDIPVPGAGVDGPTYPLRIEFADVLNLPQGAKVIADGVRVGQLTGLTLVDARNDRPGFVVADIAVQDSVRLPAGTTAELRQETPLGDVHIALTEPEHPGPATLEPGATIPLADTVQPPLIEDILAALSVFVGSGAIIDLQDIVRTMNGVLPEDPRDTARIAGALGADLSDLAGDTAAVDTVLDGLESVVEQGVLDNAVILDDLLTPYGVQHTTDAINTQIGVIFVLTSLGPVGPAVSWVAPIVQSLDATVRAVVPMLFGSAPLDTSAPSTMKKLVDLLHTEIIPLAEQGPRIDLTRITVADAPTAMPEQEQTARVIDTLRMIGAVR